MGLTSGNEVWRIKEMYPTLIALGPITIGSYGVFLALAFLLGSFLVWKKGREERFEEEDIFDGILLGVFWGIVVARIVYVILNWADFAGKWLETIAVTRVPGLNFLGGLLGGLGYLYFFAKKKKWDVLKSFDVFCLGIALSQIVGYMGSFLNGNLYGTRVSLAWAMNFPGVEGARHPAQLYGAFLYLLLLLLLLKIFKEYRTYEWYKQGVSEPKPGLTFFGYIFGMGLIQLILSLVTPSQIYLKSFAIEGWTGLALLVVGVVGVYMRSERKFDGDAGVVVNKVGTLFTKIRNKSADIPLRKRVKRKKRLERGIDLKE